jgi:hypothetical protein
MAACGPEGSHSHACRCPGPGCEQGAGGKQAVQPTCWCAALAWALLGLLLALQDGLHQQESHVAA